MQNPTGFGALSYKGSKAMTASLSTALEEDTNIEVAAYVAAAKSTVVVL